MAADFVSADSALAWGSTGHRFIGQAAVEALPPELPPFLRTSAMAAAVGEASREPDRSRGAGKTHDADRDPGHFVNADDSGLIAGIVSLAAVPSTREEYESALRSAGADSWRAGYLPYSIVSDWQQLAKDFAYWRADNAAAAHSPDGGHRAWFMADRTRREAQIVDDLGALSHFVGDGSMPLHVSVHFNGWGPFPNPGGYTQERVHTPWEGAYVRRAVTYAAVQAAMTPMADCRCPIERRIGAYLAADLATVVPFYQLEKSGAFKAADPKGAAFTAARLGAGASELRDEIVLAWRASAHGKVGYPEADVTDIEAGRLDPYDNLFGSD
jgi:hypothetical protein